MWVGNLLYDEANLGGWLLGVYDAVDLLCTRLMIAPRGNIGCRCEQVLVDELQRLSTLAHQESRVIAAVLVQTPMTVGIALTPDRSILIFD